MLSRGEIGAGNDAVDFEKRIVWIKWIGTYKDYDKIDVNEVEHER